MITTDTLTDLEAAVLRFEECRWAHSGAKEVAIRDNFGWSVVRYIQVLHALLDRPAALVAHPTLVRRLQRLQAERARRRRAA